MLFLLSISCSWRAQHWSLSAPLLYINCNLHKSLVPCLYPHPCRLFNQVQQKHSSFPSCILSIQVLLFLMFRSLVITISKYFAPRPMPVIRIRDVALIANRWQLVFLLCLQQPYELEEMPIFCFLFLMSL